MELVAFALNSAAMMMSGKSGEAAFVDIRGIGGLTENVNRRLSEKVRRLLNQSPGVASNRIHLDFIDVAAGNRGWNGQAFGWTKSRSPKRFFAWTVCHGLI